MTLNLAIILDYPGRPSGITRVLKSGRGGRRKRTRDGSVRTDLAGFENGGRRPRAKE